MSTIVHLLLAVTLTLFLALQARSLVVVLRHRRAASAPRRRTDLLWTSIPIVVVLVLAARSWVAVFGLAQPEPAAAITQAEPDATPRAAGPQ